MSRSIDELLSGAEETDDLSLPPHDGHAEEAVLGAVLKKPDTVGLLTHLSPSDFYQPRYRTIWRAMLDLQQRNTPIDYTTLSARLAGADMAEARVGLADLATINLSVPSAANAEHYARLISAAATQRRYIEAAQKIAAKAWQRQVNIDDLMLQAEALVTAARPSDSRRDLYSPERWAETFRDDLSARAAGHRTSVTTGLRDVDAMTLGLEAGALYLLMGTPGTGKTELAMQIAIYVANTHGPVLFASLEMSVIELAQRYARIRHGMDRNKLAKGDLTEDELDLSVKVMNAMQASRLWPASPSGKYTTADLRADALEVQAQTGHVALIVADYVQRFDDGDGVPAHREINVGMVAKGLKSLAREFKCPVLAPVQPNREYVNRPNKRPILPDLRESGKLEQEADMVLGLFREEKHGEVEASERGVAELHVLKNRSSVGDSDGFRKLRWGETRYVNYAQPAGVLPWREEI